MVRQGVLDSPPKTPVTMGFECAGEVEAVGDNTQGVAVSSVVCHNSPYSANPFTIQCKSIHHTVQIYSPYSANPFTIQCKSIHHTVQIHSPYSVNPKTQTDEQITIIILRFEQCGFTTE